MSSRFVPLAELLAAGREESWLVARSGGGDLPFGRFARRVAALHAQLAESPRGRWLLLAESPVDFAAGLLALWHSGSCALVPPNGLPATLLQLLPAAEGIVCDRPPALAGVRCIDLRERGEREPPPWGALRADAVVLELATSGTTSAPKRVEKRLAQLDTELRAQEDAFGAPVGDAPVLATVSHQHLYGLAFHVLWPLCAGRPIWDETILQPAELLPRLRRAGAGVLVSTPTHLRRLAERADLGEFAPHLREILCSGGPLPDAAADALARGLGWAPLELYGSTETGGVAWRRQSPGPERLAWTPLGGVEVRVDARSGRLGVVSPFASAPGDGPQLVETSDLARALPDGRFLLLGRADRVVKVGEKPVSLPDLEAHLCAHPFVRDAACAALASGGDARVGAAIVLSPAGREAADAQGRRGVSRALDAHLRHHWAPVTVPRVWRFVGSLPADAQGKVPAAALRRLFDAAGDRRRGPDVVEERVRPDGCERVLWVPEDLSAVEGHFPARPVVPGVVLLQWVVQAARELLGVSAAPTRIEALKFHHALLPGRQIELRVARRDDGRSLGFEVSAGGRLLSSGRLRLAAEAGGSS
jgi:3-hydroxymyristoyl/3-hydroxydecanoyl-(acyl carrier protein) dehydratase